MTKYFRYSILLVAALLSCQPREGVPSYVNAYDPMLDGKCQISTIDKGEKWPGGYMWHPGQLAAWLQADNLRRSKARCVNVNYPDSYYKMSESTLFRTTISFERKTLIEWRSSGEVSMMLDGNSVETENSSIEIPEGEHTIVMQVETEGRTPALIVKGGQTEDNCNWSASIQGEDWVPVESDARFCYPDVLPDDPFEAVASIPYGETLSLKGGEQCLVDFRHLELGQVRMHAKGKARLAFVVGESPEEAQNTDLSGFEQYALDTLDVDGEMDITLPERGMRYLNISAVDGECTVEKLVMDARMWPVEYQMDFSCDDEELNNIFQASIATIHTCMHNFYLDGVKRDFLPWGMDAIVSSLGADFAFGDQLLTRNGISIALMPENPKESDLGVIDYPLHALVGLEHEYMRYGDIRTSLMFQKRILSQMELYMSMQDENGFISASEDGWGFISGWNIKNGPEHGGTAAYAQMILMQNFRIAARFARLWQRPELAQLYQKKASQLERSIVECFWDNDRKVFINGYYADKTRDERISHHTQYWSVLTGLYPEQEYDHLYDEVYPAIPHYMSDISLEKGYEAMAYARAGRTRQFLDFLKASWGYWLKKGHTRFPENFLINGTDAEQLEFYDRPYGLSLCHAVNGVPMINAVIYGLFGFEQDMERPGEYSVSPRLYGLKHMRGYFTVREGRIQIQVDEDGNVKVDAPEGCKVQVK